MRHPFQRLRRFFAADAGATAVEYGLLLALLALVVVGAVTATGTALYNRVNVASAKLGS